MVDWREELYVSKKPQPRKPHRKMSRHHRKPRFSGGNGVDRSNIIRVPINQHRAYHLLFEWGYPVGMIAFVLNQRWVSLDTVLVPIPTEKLMQTIALLKKLGIRLSPEELGITVGHKKYFSQ